MVAQLVEALRYKRKVAGSFNSGLTGIFHWHNPSGRTMALGLPQPLTEMSTRNITWGVEAAGAYGWQSYNLHVPIILKSGSLNLLEPSGSVQVCNGTALRTVHCMEINVWNLLHTQKYIYICMYVHTYIYTYIHTHIYHKLVGLLHVSAYLGIIPRYAETCSRFTSVWYVHILMRVIKSNTVPNVTQIGQ